MLETDASLYLPISDEMLRRVFDDGAGSLETLVSDLAVPQLAALVVLQDLSRLNTNRPPSPEQILAKAIEIGNLQVKNGRSPADILPELCRPKLREGYELLPDFGIALLDDEALRHRSYLTAERNWDFGFRERHRARLIGSLVQAKTPSGETRILTAEQSRIFAEIRAQADDHMHVQGYAGTGKSWLIKALLAILVPKGAEILVLAQFQRQLDALIGRMAQVHPKTFGDLAYALIPQDLTRGGRSHRHMRRKSMQATMPDEVLVRHLGIHACGDCPAERIAKAVRGTVAAFCYSGDDEIDANHIPDRYASSFDEMARVVVLNHATELWKAYFSPTSRDFRPPVRDYHRIKWAALNQLTIPTRYTHVLIDECHDLAKPILQILDRSPQAVISLGDEYQNLRGRARRRSNVVRQREVTTSVRSGRAIEEIVNPIIAVHPGKTKVPFRGNWYNKLEIDYFDKSRVPDQITTIVTSSNWGLFEWAQRITNDDLDVVLLSDLNDLTRFVEDCIELYRVGTPPRHGELFRYRSWSDVARVHHANLSFRHIDAWLKKGYTYSHWEKTAGRFAKPGSRAHSLGLIEDVRNHEFDSVMVTEEVADQAWRANSEALGRVGSGIYVAVTRSKRRLILPEGLRNWIEEISATQALQRANRAVAAEG